MWPRGDSQYEDQSRLVGGHRLELREWTMYTVTYVAHTSL